MEEVNMTSSVVGPQNMTMTTTAESISALSTPSPSTTAASLTTTHVAFFTTFLSTLTPTITTDALTPESNLTNITGGGDDGGHLKPHSMTMIVVMTVIYILITITGVVGNVATCVVIVRNRIMHTATNYYLFSMAISDLLLLSFGMPDDIYLLWWGQPYIFGEEFCFIRGFTAEISTNATILTIAAFTVERYIGICHPLRSHTMSQLGRVIRFIAVIWVVATACAVPIAIQYGIVYEETPDGKQDPSTASCLMKKRIALVFEISSVLFFVAPMLLIMVLYVCIAVQLKKSTRMARSVPSIGSHNYSSTNDGSRNKAVIKMLVAVVIAFFVCFAPHQAQRLVAVHGDPSNPFTQKLFNVLHNISGISYYISTCVNPILYHIMSNRFRQALKVTLESCFGGSPGAGGGFQDSDATLDNFKNGLSSHHFPLPGGRHQRSLSMQHHRGPFRNSTSTTTTSTGSFHHHNNQRLYHSQYQRQRPLLHHHQSTKATGSSRTDEALKTNGTSHTWV